MNLHTNTTLFRQSLRAVSTRNGISEVFVEKDYWITLVLLQLAESAYASQVVFKGGTSLSKGYGCIHRFSEDVDVAVITNPDASGNAVKTLLRQVEKSMMSELREIHLEGVSSKGSRFRKTVVEYPTIQANALTKQANTLTNRLILEVNSFANPYPFHQGHIRSMIAEFFEQEQRADFLEEYGLHGFTLNILAKEQTLVEKMVSLFRSSFDQYPLQGLGQKIRHFYDVYYLMEDADCLSFVGAGKFTEEFHRLFAHDKAIFDDPQGWHMKSYTQSPLVSEEFPAIWQQLSTRYREELSALAFAPIPDESAVAERFLALVRRL